MHKTILAAALSLAAVPAFAQETEPQGDVAAGEEQFARQCVACHVVENEAGEILAGRSGRTGPNLYGIAGRPFGAVEDFRYSDALLALNEAGEHWTEEAFVGFVQDPTAWVREVLDDAGARSLMSYRVRQEQQARDLYAYLASLAPAAAEDEEPAAEEAEAGANG